jgi:predicted P-loop ATPase
MTDVQLKIVDDAEVALLARGVLLRFNEFKGQVEIETPESGQRPMDDCDRGLIRLILDEAGSRVKTGLMDPIIDRIARKPANRFHPVRAYLDSLVWDGVPRINSWLHTYMWADDTPFVREVGRLVLIAAVRRVRQPGCKFDECLVLVGAEGIGKSTAVKTMAGEWFSDSLPLGANPKETAEQTSGVWLCESAELVGNTHAKIAEIKAFLSRFTDGPFRAAWGRTSGQVPRQFIPIATTNDAAFLHSTTGDRRFWPVKVYGSAPELVSARDQLWAEASVLERGGGSIRLPEELWGAAREIQAAFRVEHPWETTLKGIMVDSVSLPDIFVRLDIPVERQTVKAAQDIAAIMAGLGYQKNRAMREGVRTTYYDRWNPYMENEMARGPVEEVDTPVDPDTQPHGDEFDE